jgi:hypothetical protein
MTPRGRLEAELKVWVNSSEFAEAKTLMARVADLRWRIVQEEYLEKYGKTDRPRGDGL